MSEKFSLHEAAKRINNKSTFRIIKNILGYREIDLNVNWNQRELDLPSLNEVNDFLKIFKNNAKPNSDNKLSAPENVIFSRDQLNILNSCKIQLQEIKNNEVTRRSVKRIIVQGKAGSGKSTVIKEIVRLIQLELGFEAVEVAAATGMAAVNVKGKTLHSLLKLPNTRNSFEPLKPDQAKHLRTELKNLKFLIIDEMSLIGLRMLYMINYRCQEIKDNIYEPFGGMFIYLFGDYNQLPPVGDDAVYGIKLYKDEMKSSGKIIFRSFQRHFLLENAHRQKNNDSLLSKILDQVAIGELSVTNYMALNKRWQSNLSETEINDFKNAVHLYPTNDKVNAHNEKRLKSNCNPVARIEAINSSDFAAQCSTVKSSGLQNVLYLSRGCRIMLQTNIWVEGGVTNGTMGTVSEIVFKKGESPPKLPQFILANLDNYKGPFIRETLFPIIPVTRDWNYKNNYCSRTQLPVSIAYAISIHKAQGQTLDKVKVDVGPCEKNLGQAYVALSRVRNISDLILINKYPKKRYNSIKEAKLFQDRQFFLDNF